MKKIIGLILCILVTATGFSAYAAEAPIQNAPYLEDISFSNAQIDGGFKQGETFFTLTLDDPKESAVLGKYTINGNCKMFVNYTYDDSNHQTGMVITLNFASGSIIYTFLYSNAENYSVSNNANLQSLSCEYGEVQPEINSGDTAYKLYIPSDLTELSITPVTQDINAYAAPLTLTLREGQETEIPITVTASDSSTKKYIFKIKRVNKTIAEVEKEMENPDYESFVEGELFYQKPVFIISAGAVAGGIVVIAVLYVIIKRVAVNPYDEEEKEFYKTAD